MDAFLFHGKWPAKKPWLDGVPDIITGEPRPERGNLTGSRIKDSHKMHKTLFCFDQSPQTPPFVSSVCHMQKAQKRSTPIIYVKEFIIS